MSKETFFPQFRVDLLFRTGGPGCLECTDGYIPTLILVFVLGFFFLCVVYGIGNRAFELHSSESAMAAAACVASIFVTKMQVSSEETHTWYHLALIKSS